MNHFRQEVTETEIFTQYLTLKGHIEGTPREELFICIYKVPMKSLTL